MTEPDRLEAEFVARLRLLAKSRSEAMRTIAQAKSIRQGDNPERRIDIYAWPAWEETDEWKAADLIEKLACEKAFWVESATKLGEKLDRIETNSRTGDTVGEAGTAAFAQEVLDFLNVLSAENIGEGVHAGLRKGTDASDGSALWSAISKSTTTAWSDACSWALDPFFTMWGGEQLRTKAEAIIAALSVPQSITPPEVGGELERDAIDWLSERIINSTAWLAKCESEVAAFSVQSTGEASFTVFAEKWEEARSAVETELRRWQALADIVVDRDEWRTQHENLLSVRQSDLATLSTPEVVDGTAGLVDALESIRDAASIHSSTFARAVCGIIDTALYQHRGVS